MEDIIYFELDNWFCGRDYPNAEPFNSWFKNDLGIQFADDEWCKENKLCVEAGPIDMSLCFCIAAPRSWVEANCPKLLTDEECGSYSITSHFDKEQDKWIDERKYESCKYSKFICKMDEYGDVDGKLSGWRFPEYKEENFGVHWNNYWWEDTEDEEDEEESEE